MSVIISLNIYKVKHSNFLKKIYYVYAPYFESVSGFSVHIAKRYEFPHGLHYIQNNRKQKIIQIIHFYLA